MTADMGIEAVKDGPTVFFSYARADQKQAKLIIAALEAAGCKVWWDGLLAGGETFLPTTEAALEGADAVVVLWSKTSLDSHWVRDEATVGRDRRRLVPLSLGGVAPPLGFRQFQVIDLTAWNGRADAPEMLGIVQAISSFAGRAPVGVVQLQPAVSRRAWIAGGAVAAIAVAGGGFTLWTRAFSGKAGASNSVAVLPFANLSGDPAKAYFADGLSEEIRLGVARIDGLRVLAPMSAGKAAETYKEDVPTIGRALAADYVLRGSVRQSGERIRIAAELLDSKDNAPAWSDQFDRTMTDIFSLQAEIADNVADVLSAQFVRGNKADKGEQGGTNSGRAFDAYLRGNAYYALRSGEAAYRAALKQYDAALAIDDDYAKAHAARARVITVITNAYAKASEFEARYDDAVRSARRAVAIAPDLAIAQSTLGFVLVQGKLDLRGARQPYEISNRLGKGDATVQLLYAAYAAEMGWQDKALTAINRSVGLDPLNPAAHRILAFVHYCARRFDPAIAACRKALELNPKLSQANAYWGDALLQKNAVAEALARFEKETDQMTRLTGIAIAQHRLGNAPAAQAAYDALIGEFADGSTYQQAQVHAQWGQIDEALQKLLLARKIGDVGLAYAFTDPFLDPLRQRAEFSDLLKDLGFV